MAVPEVRWGNEAKYLAECVETNFVSTVGKFVSEFETAVTKRMSCAKAVSMVTGTAAIHLGLVALGVRPGDLVIVPSFTFIATANAISHAGALPWLFDIGEACWTLDAAQVEKALEEKTVMVDGAVIHRETGRRVAALLPVHVLGTAADMTAFQKIAQKYGLGHLADGACAIGVTHRGRPLAGFCDLTTLSFNGNKTITSGGGGMLLGNDGALMERIRHLGTTARVGADYDHDAVGYNYRMTNLEAAVGLAQLEQLDRFLDRKRAIREAYTSGFAQLSELNGFPHKEGEESACWLSGVVFSQDRTDGPVRLIEALRDRRIEARPFWKPVHLQEPYSEMLREDLTVTESLWHRIVTLPSSVSLTAEQQKRVIGAVVEMFAPQHA